MDYPKSVPNVGLVNGKFVDENTATGQVGSLIPSSWGNAITDELLNVIQAGGEQPAENDNDQLLAAIKAIVRDSIPPEKIRTTLADYGITDAYTKSVTYTKAEIEALLKNMSALPVGAMVPFPRGEVPPGFIEVDGSVKSAAAYPDLAAYLGGNFNIGNEGAGNFRLPESRGEFLRGWDHGRGVDPGRALGSKQDASIVSAGDAAMTGASVVAFYNDLNDDAAAFRARLNSDGVPSGLTNVKYVGTGANISGPGTDSAMYVRPRNMAVMWCIKAWNAPINQGNIDVAALASLAAQATEINQGTAKVATTAQMLDSANDFVLSTPKKLRWGLSVSLASNGYIAAPFWLGGWVIQWGTTGAVSPTPAVVSFPMAFPSEAYVALAIGYLGQTNVSANQDAIYSFGLSKNGVSFKTYGSSVANGAKYIAIGS